MEAITRISVSELPGKNILEWLTGLERVYVEAHGTYKTKYTEGELMDYLKLNHVREYEVVEGEDGPEFRFVNRRWIRG